MLSIHALALRHFRNYEQVQIDTGGQSVLLTGPNGAGKTNILEAVSLLSPGRGLRKARLGGMKNQSSESPWVVAADMVGLDGEVHIGTSLDPESSATERRLVKIDGEKIRGQTALAQQLSISWQTPQMDGLFLASDGERRRYLDRLIYGFDAEHLARVSRYEHAMRERNKLLAYQPWDDRWLHALEETMAASSIAIASARLEVIARLNQSIANEAGCFPKAILQMDGEPERLVQGHAASDAEAMLAQRFAESRGRDGAAGRALYGAHRSVLEVFHEEKQMAAAFCSTGEQKALLLSILLAHARARKDWLGVAPILLLDETVAHLDHTRRIALADLVQALNTQVWLTGTDAADFRAFEGFVRHFEVSDGEAVKQ